ncbi:efflux RND transporter periplasmic adaptor subunit [Pseudomonas shirazensis]|uniref:efflux RND transporter periplasmic adaptor subunit n=1 Tax=Pseudomonas shirazensis TaxID=2745494 RepID=UPI0016462970|nr:HlyD family efflux transporter periplasmic adaptor subunit [Pseudomonas shirazensis]MBV4502618.1 HlyD family efflux transporter periplasmic adaptor subunit [Pseudomonas shirazensis]
MTAAAGGAVERAFAVFLGLQRQARQAATAEQLGFTMVNDGQALFGFRHAALLIAGKVQALTGISVVEANAPFVAFVERAAARLHSRGAEAGPVDPTELDEQTVGEWQALSAAHACWLPLNDREGETFGGLWLAREQSFSEAELTLLGQLAETYAHAWLALRPGKPWRLRWPRRRIAMVLGAALLMLLVPVRQAVLAPAEVVPLGGRVVAAPLDGVVAEIRVKPNQRVEAGELLVRLDATTLKAQADVAERSLGVAEAELKASTQRAFSDAQSNARLDLLAARVEQKRAELDYARQLLARSEIRAERAGIAVFADAERWTGKPVQTGERLMQIADPNQAQLRMELPVGDAIALQPGAEVALFLDSDPLQRHVASLERAAYEAQLTAAGQLAYRLDASFTEPPPRIGLRGTAKLYGARAPLVYYLLRKPLAALRQGLGV